MHTHRHFSITSKKVQTWQKLNGTCRLAQFSMQSSRKSIVTTEISMLINVLRDGSTISPHQLRALRPLQPVLGREGGLLRRRDAEGADMSNLRSDLMPVG